MELFKTVREEADAVQIIEKSRFIAHVKPVTTREEAEAFLAEVRANYKDATHNVPAFVIGDKFQIQWGSDDGEPQGTSGAPMVQMLVKEGITNVAIVVTRYFGGIKLGTGGLVRAYTSSAQLGLDAAGICSVMEIVRLTINIDYTFLAKIQNLSTKNLTDNIENEIGFTIDNIEYSDKVKMDVLTLPEHRNVVISTFKNLTSGGMNIKNEVNELSKI